MASSKKIFGNQDAEKFIVVIDFIHHRYSCIFIALENETVNPFFSLLLLIVFPLKIYIQDKAFHKGKGKETHIKCPS